MQSDHLKLGGDSGLKLHSDHKVHELFPSTAFIETCVNKRAGNEWLFTFAPQAANLDLTWEMATVRISPNLAAIPSKRPRNGLLGKPTEIIQLKKNPNFAHDSIYRTSISLFPRVKPVDKPTFIQFFDKAVIDKVFRFSIFCRRCFFGD